MSDIRHRLGVNYKDSSPESQWEIEQHPTQDQRNGTPWLGNRTPPSPFLARIILIPHL